MVTILLLKKYSRPNFDLDARKCSNVSLTICFRKKGDPRLKTKSRYRHRTIFPQNAIKYSLSILKTRMFWTDSLLKENVGVRMLTVYPYIVIIHKVDSPRQYKNIIVLCFTIKYRRNILSCNTPAPCKSLLVYDIDFYNICYIIILYSETMNRVERRIELLSNVRQGRLPVEPYPEASKTLPEAHIHKRIINQ